MATPIVLASDFNQAAAASGASTVEVFARGHQGDEEMTLQINGQIVASWNNIGTATQSYSYSVPATTTVTSLRVNFSSGQGWPKSLIIDRIKIDGIAYQSEAPTTSSNGSWNPETSCSPGIKQSEWLQCPNAWFEYQATHGITLNGQPPSNDAPIVLFDTDMGPDIDDALALAMLHAYAKNGDVTIGAVTVSRNSDFGARYSDLVNTFYGDPDIPIGKYFGTTTEDSNDWNWSSPIVQSGKYPHDVHSTNQIKEGYKLMRQVLAEAPDQGVVLIQTGFSVNTAALLESGPDEISPLSGSELVEDKVAFLSFTGGQNNSTFFEFNIQKHISSAQTVFAEWPVDIVQSEWKLGYGILYPLNSILTDFSYVADHPIKDSYRTTDLSWHEDEGDYYNMRSWDLTSVIAALEPLEDYYQVSGRGNVAVNSNGTTTFTATTSGNVRSLGDHLQYTAPQKQKIIDRMIELVSEPPASWDTTCLT